MICKKCGAELPDDAKFCPDCGQSTESQAADAVNTADAEVQESAAQTDTAGVENIRAAQPTNDIQAAGDAVKKKSKALPIIAACIAGIVIIALAGIMCLGGTGFLKRTFSSPGEYLAYSIEKTRDKYSSDEEIKTGCDISYGVKVNDTVITTLNMLGEDFSFINDLRLNSAVDYASGGSVMTYDLTLGQDEVAKAEMYITEEGIYARIPGLSDDYLLLGSTSASLDGIGGGLNGALDELPAVNFDVKYISEKLPDILTRYAAIAAKSMKSAEKAREEVTLGGVSAKYTVISQKLDGQTLHDVALAVLEAAKGDGDLRELMTKLGADYTDSDIEGLISEIKDADVTEQSAGDVKFYINSKSIITGFSLKDGDDGISFMYVTDGRSSAGELDMSGSYGDKFDIKAVFSGDGKNYSGNVTSAGAEYLTFEVKDYEKSGDKISFNATVKPGKALSDMIAEDNDSGISLDGISLDFDVSGEGDTSNVTLTVKNDGTDIGSVEFKTTMRNSKIDKLPDFSDAVDLSDSDAAREWLAGVDAFDFIDAMPDEIESLIGSLINSGFFGGDDDNYGDGFGYLYECYGYDDNGKLVNMGEWYIDMDNSDGLYIIGENGEKLSPYQDDAFYFYNEDGELMYMEYDNENDDDEFDFDFDDDAA